MAKVKHTSPTRKKPAAGKRKAVEKPAAVPRIKFAGDAKIKLLVENPKRPSSGAFKRFAKYRDGMTVDAALQAGVRRDDLAWDVRHGFVAVAPPKGSPGLVRLKGNGDAETIRRAVLADQKAALADAGRR
jgi:hypothetical protein